MNSNEFRTKSQLIISKDDSLSARKTMSKEYRIIYPKHLNLEYMLYIHFNFISKPLTRCTIPADKEFVFIHVASQKYHSPFLRITV